MCSIFGLNENGNKISVSKIGKKRKLLFRVFMVVSLFGQKIYAASEANFPCNNNNDINTRMLDSLDNLISEKTQNLFICWFVCTLWHFLIHELAPEEKYSKRILNINRYFWYLGKFRYDSFALRLISMEIKGL